MSGGIQRLGKEVHMAYVAVDIESEPEAQRFSDRRIHAVGFAYEGESPICLPWNGSAQNKLKQLLRAGVTFIFHNAAYDVAVLRQKGVHIPRSYEDTFIMSHTLCPSNARFHSLDAVAQRLGLPAKLDYRERLIQAKLLDSKAKPGEEWWIPFNPVMAEYCSHDAWLTLQIYFKLQQELLSDCRVHNAYREYFLPFCECLMQLQKGVRIDRNKLFVYIAEIIKELEQYKAKLIGEFPIVPDMQFDREQRRFEPKHNPIKWVPFNPDSNYHRIWCLSKLGWEPTEWTEGGLPKCGIDHLLDFSVNCEWARNLIEYQKRASIVSQCVQILEHSSNDGCIKPRWHLCNTRTHRMSCSEPNLQNICSADRNPTSRFLRESFIPKPGHKFIVLDFQRIELVILAYLMDEAGDQRLADAIIAGKDPHQHNAEVWGCSRPDAKNGIFAVNYGASAPRLAQTIHCSLEHAQEIIDKINTNSPVISLLKQKLAQSMRCPSITTVYDVHTQEWMNVGLVYDVYGSRYVYSDVKSKNFRLRARAERQAFNVKMQGSVGSLICKLASKALPVLARYQARYVLQVHDELVIEVPEHHTNNCLKEVDNVFSSEYLGRIPIRISIGSGCSWAEAKH